MTMLEFSQNNGVSAEGSPNTPVRSVPIAEWTIADRAAWERAIAPRARLRKGGAGAHLARITQNDLARRYGYFVDHLMRNDLFKPDAPLAGQVTPDRVELARSRRPVPSTSCAVRLNCSIQTGTSHGSRSSRRILP